MNQFINLNTAVENRLATELEALVGSTQHFPFLGYVRYQIRQVAAAAKKLEKTADSITRSKQAAQEAARQLTLVLQLAASLSEEINAHCSRY